MGIGFIAIAVIVLFILQYNRAIDSRRFIEDSQPYFNFLMEEDYAFLLSIKYGSNVDVEKLFGQRVRNGLVTIVAMVFIFLSKLNFIYLLTAILVGYIIFKLPYQKLKKYYKANLSNIDSMLPYYLKSLEILIQHYTVPVALSRSIETAPEIFVSGLKRLIAKIDAGVSTVDPYMDFAKEYPVRDSMRMMRLLYRLGLGSQENKQEQLMMFSRTVSTLQNKAREMKYKNRLETMESKTMLMLGCTGGGIIMLLLFSMMQMMNI
ncbi:MAG: hypothetical protein RR266_04135 [Bacilli bacterium]